MSVKSFLNRLNQRSCPLVPKVSPVFKITLFVLISITSVFLVTSVLAKNVYVEKRDAIKEGGNQESWLNESFASNSVTALQVITDEIPDKVINGDITGYVPGGLLGTSTKMIASLYSPAASGIEYIAQTWDSFLGKPAYAQATGQGFTGLQGILPLWRGFRNITYVLASLVFIIIGIMIMLRVKISPQAVITIQNAIPQIITTLILITFSYAIAGLLIDLMQFLQAFFVAILFQATGKGLTANILTTLLSPGYSFSELTTGGMNTVAGLTLRAIPTAPLVIWGAIIGGLIGGIFGLGVGSVPGVVVGGSVVTIVLLLIICILMLVWMFQFYFGCLKCYVTVIFKIIIGPLELAMGAFPNSKVGFSTWIWDLVANLAVFPISMIFLILGNMIIDASVLGLWAPHIIKDLSLQSFVIVGGSLGNIVGVGLGLAVVAIVAKLPDLIPKAIFMIKPSDFQNAIGEGLNPKWMQNSMAMAKGTVQQGVHNDLETLSGSGGRLGRLLGTAAKGMEIGGFAKENRHP